MNVAPPELQPQLNSSGDVMSRPSEVLRERLPTFPSPRSVPLCTLSLLASREHRHSTEEKMAKDDKRIIEEVDGVARERKDARPDFSQPPPRKQLPTEIQSKLNDEEIWDTLYDGK
jgi:hypothetical protein